jgi:hypothetical protein
MFYIWIWTLIQTFVKKPRLETVFNIYKLQQVNHHFIHWIVWAIFIHVVRITMGNLGAKRKAMIVEKNCAKCLFPCN